jgi:hypothetical protein
MHMKSLRALCKHARGRPLLRPEANPRENPFVAPHKFAEAPTVTLRMNFSWKNFHARNPRALYLWPRTVCRRELAGINTGIRDALRQRACLIIARSEGVSRFIAQAGPQVRVVSVHVDLLKPLIANEKSARSREKFGPMHKSRC